MKKNKGKQKKEAPKKRAEEAGGWRAQQQNARAVMATGDLRALGLPLKLLKRVDGQAILALNLGLKTEIDTLQIQGNDPDDVVRAQAEAVEAIRGALKAMRKEDETAASQLEGRLRDENAQSASGKAVLVGMIGFLSRFGRR